MPANKQAIVTGEYTTLAQGIQGQCAAEIHVESNMMITIRRLLWNYDFTKEFYYIR